MIKPQTGLKIYGPIRQLVTMQGIRMHGPVKDEQLDPIADAYLVLDGEKVIAFGGEEILQTYKNAEQFDFNGQDVIALPAFIDCHTHICWAGNRIDDYALRVGGATYLEIAKKGGGIMDTVRNTRKADSEELVAGIKDRAEQLFSRGVHIIEVKSGYGLNAEDELKMLRCIQQANEETRAELVPTFLGAHIPPADFDGDEQAYLDMLLSEVIPVIEEEKLARRADIFVEEGAFNVEMARSYAAELKNRGFDMTMHVDQFHSGGAQLAVESGCVSADHLEFTDDECCAAFAHGDTVAVALPGASLGLGMKFTPARKILDQQGSLAIASDWNPGSAPMGDLLTQASLLGVYEKLSIAEVLAGVTFRAAHALGIKSGVIEENKRASVIFFKTRDFREVVYRQGQLTPSYSLSGSIFHKH
jgi:imidazolonepropionase